MFKAASLAAIAIFTLSACGDTTGEQAVIGGAAGAGTAAVTNGNVVAGAAVGAGANILYCEANPGRC